MGFESFRFKKLFEGGALLNFGGGCQSLVGRGLGVAKASATSQGEKGGPKLTKKASADI